MSDSTLKKIDSQQSPAGEMGQAYLATGTRLGMRLWQEMEPGASKPERSRDYETVGYVISGRAELLLEGQTATLNPGDSWVVPEGANHTYRILEPFTAVEATSPPASVKGRDEAPGSPAE
jgi:quercetin dioxygenase-like cupin family protein